MTTRLSIILAFWMLGMCAIAWISIDTFSKVSTQLIEQKYDDPAYNVAGSPGISQHEGNFEVTEKRNLLPSTFFGIDTLAADMTDWLTSSLIIIISLIIATIMRLMGPIRTVPD